MANYYITVHFDDVIRGVKTELHQRVFLQVYFRELHIYMLKKYATEVSIEYYEKGIFRISDSAI